MDSKGQLSFEYLMIFAISLIILVVFTLPMLNTAIENTLDVSDSINADSDLSEISAAVKEVYSQGQGARQKVTVDCSKNMKINVNPTYVSCTIELKDGSRKSLSQSYNSKLTRTSLNLGSGVNTVVVEWPAGYENMIIFVE